MTAPSCPIHATPMNVSTYKDGGFFCSKRDGQNYCLKRSTAGGQIYNKGEQPPADSPTSAPSGAAAAQIVAAPAVNSDAQIACGAFELAGAVYAGQIHSEDLQAQDAVIAFAVRAYTAMKTVMP